MIDKIKNSENILTQAAAKLRSGEMIVIKRETGEKIALYAAEFLNETERTKYPLTDDEFFIALAKRAGLLPALVLPPVGKMTENSAVFSEKSLKEDLAHYGEIIETARAKLPLAGAENSTLVSFREYNSDLVHLALIIGGGEDKKTPLVRVHSSCVTGDLLGSLRCDCGDQLKLALEAIKQAGYGVLLYLNQEGRGIGITNKLRAYGLQEQGLDTFAANEQLGFAADERDFSVASAILKNLEIEEIKLLSNNPHKTEALQKLGIKIIERVPLIAEAGKHNRDYIVAKAQKAGHFFGDNVGEGD